MKEQASEKFVPMVTIITQKDLDFIRSMGFKQMFSTSLEETKAYLDSYIAKENFDASRENKN